MVLVQTHKTGREREREIIIEIKRIRDGETERKISASKIDAE